jgi:hypothetical protein
MGWKRKEGNKAREVTSAWLIGRSGWQFMLAGRSDRFENGLGEEFGVLSGHRCSSLLLILPLFS